MRKKSNKQYAVALYEISQDAPKSHWEEIAKQFLGLLQKDRKLTKVNLIIDEFEKYSKKQEGINEIEIESARELDKTTINKIKKMFGEKSDVKTIVNPDMIGGVRIKVDDVVYDASLKKQLSRLKTSLI